MGLTIVKYADVLTCIEQLLRFLLRKFNVLDALPVISDICGETGDQDKYHVCPV